MINPKIPCETELLRKFDGRFESNTPMRLPKRNRLTKWYRVRTVVRLSDEILDVLRITNGD